MVTSDVMPPFVFPHGLRLGTEAYIKSLEKVSLGQEDPTSGNGTLHHAILARDPSLGSEKISDTISPLTSGCLTCDL